MKNLDKLVVATRNPAKVNRYQKILSSLVNQVIGLNDIGLQDKPKETGETAEENAEIKAKFYAKKSGLPVFSEDEALYVDFLPRDKQPGVHVRRINGKDEAGDTQLLEHWEKIVKEVPKQKRTGKWHIAYTFAHPNGLLNTATLDHPIVFFSPPSLIRIPGWPMSSLQGPAAFNKPHSELTEDEKQLHEQNTNQMITKKLIELIK